VLDFSFTPEQEQLRRTLRAFALRELLPRYARGDRERRYPREQVQAVCRLVWADTPAAEMDLVTAGIVAEEVARGDLNCVLMSLGPCQLRAFLKEAPEPLRARWIPRIASGEAVIALALTEPGAGSDMGAMQTAARPEGDAFVLNGEKNSVSFLNADLFYVFARTERGTGDWRGISAFLVPRETPGLAFHAYEDMGCRAVPRGQLVLQDVRVPAANMVGPRGAAFKMILAYLPIEQRLRDVLGWQIGDGTPQIQKLLIARHLLGREFAPET
jgi:cyclohexanecarboxyl-CoA dehydrogenase